MGERREKRQPAGAFRMVERDGEGDASAHGMSDQKRPLERQRRDEFGDEIALRP